MIDIDLSTFWRGASLRVRYDAAAVEDFVAGPSERLALLKREDQDQIFGGLNTHGVPTVPAVACGLEVHRWTDCGSDRL